MARDLDTETDPVVLSQPMGAMVSTPLGTSGDHATTNEERIRAATIACVARFGLTKTTVEDIARESGLSRATIYRAHPGGREALLQDALVGEICRFFDELATLLDQHDDLEDLVVVGLGASLRFLQEHAALRAIVTLEPGLLLSHFAFHRLDVVLATVAGFAGPYLEPHTGSPDGARAAAEHLVRIVLSYAMHPSPAVDPFDEASLRRLVRTHVLPSFTHRPPEKEAP